MMNESSADLFHLTVTGSYEAVVSARKKFDSWLTKSKATAQARNELALVLTEICNNAVEHGSATESEPMQITGKITNGLLEVEVIEKSGDAVDPIGKALLDSFSVPAVDSERGRGLFLIRVYVDELQIDTNDRDKLRIRLQKRIRT